MCPAHKSVISCDAKTLDARFVHFIISKNSKKKNGKLHIQPMLRIDRSDGPSSIRGLPIISSLANLSSLTKHGVVDKGVINCDTIKIS